MESKNPIDINLDFALRIDMTSEFSNKEYIVFVARSKWCRKDHLDPTLYNIGFQIIEVSPEDLNAFVRIFEKYGNDAKSQKANAKRDDYLWR